MWIDGARIIPSVERNRKHERNRKRKKRNGIAKQIVTLLATCIVTISIFYQFIA